MEHLATAIRAEVAHRVADVSEPSAEAVGTPGGVGGSPPPDALEGLLRQLLAMARLLDVDGLAPGGKPSMVRLGRGLQLLRKTMMITAIMKAVVMKATVMDAWRVGNIQHCIMALWHTVLFPFGIQQALQFELRDVAAYAEAVSGGSNVEEAVLWRHIHTALERIIAPLQPSIGTPTARYEGWGHSGQGWGGCSWAELGWV